MPFPAFVLLEALDPKHTGSPACTLLQALSELLFKEQKDKDDRIMRLNQSDGIF